MNGAMSITINRVINSMTSVIRGIKHKFEKLKLKYSLELEMNLSISFTSYLQVGGWFCFYVKFGFEFGKEEKPEHCSWDSAIN